MQIIGRCKQIDRVPAKTLLPNPKSWQTYAAAQQDAVRGVLSEVEWADAVLAVGTADGLMPLDGHLRDEVAPDGILPVLVFNATEGESW